MQTHITQHPYAQHNAHTSRRITVPDRLETKQVLECGASQYQHSSYRTSAHLIACRTTELRRATRSAARLSRHVGSTVSCGEWEERKRWEVGENVGIFVLWAVYATRGGSCPPPRGSVRFFKFSTALKSSKKFLFFLNNLYIKYCYWSVCPHRRIPTLQTCCPHSQI